MPRDVYGGPFQETNNGGGRELGVARHEVGGGAAGNR